MVLKKNNRLRNIGILVGILLIVAIVGITILNTLKVTPSSNADIVIKDNVTIITDETIKEKQPIVVTDEELIFSSNPRYSKGEIIVAGIIDSAPSGFIRKVVNIKKKDNQYIVKTEIGFLTDVFEKVHIDKTFALTQNSATEVSFNSIKQAGISDRIQTIPSANNTVYCANAVNLTTATPVSSLLDNETNYQFAKEFEYDIAKNISVHGEVGFNVWIEVALDINHGEVTFGIVAHNESGGEISVNSTADVMIEIEKELFSYDLPNIQFMAGIVPIVITNEIQSDIEGEAHIQGKVGTSFKIESKNSSGFQYNSETNKVEEIKEKSYDSDGLHWGTEAKLSGGYSVGAFLHLSSKLYDCTGADIAVGIEGMIEGEVSVSPNEIKDGLNYVGSIDLAIRPKLQGSIVVTTPIVDKKLTGQPIFVVKLTPFWEKHWDSGEDWKAALEKVEGEDTYKTTEWYQTYKKIIEDLIAQQDSPQIYFQEIYFADGVKMEPDTPRGGVSDGYPLNSSELLFFIKDISHNNDEIPELFIGARLADTTSLLAVYTFNKDTHVAHSILTVSVSENYIPAIYLCTSDLLLEKNTLFGDQLYMLHDTGDCIPYSDSGQEQDEVTVIDSATLEWKPSNEW